MKKIILFAFLLSACQMETASKLDPQLCLDYSGDPNMRVDSVDFRVTDEGGIGAFTFTGLVQIEGGSNPYTGDPEQYVYLVVNDDGSTAFDYFYELAAEQFIDKRSHEKLYLKLGVINEIGKLASSAYIDEGSQEKILAAVDKKSELTLEMLMGTRTAMGASVDATNPCLIDVD